MKGFWSETHLHALSATAKTYQTLLTPTSSREFNTRTLSLFYSINSILIVYVFYQLVFYLQFDKCSSNEHNAYSIMKTSKYHMPSKKTAQLLGGFNSDPLTNVPLTLDPLEALPQTFFLYFP